MNCVFGFASTPFFHTYIYGYLFQYRNNVCVSAHGVGGGWAAEQSKGADRAKYFFSI